MDLNLDAEMAPIEPKSLGPRMGKQRRRSGHDRVLARSRKENAHLEAAQLVGVDFLAFGAHDNGCQSPGIGRRELIGQDGRAPCARR